LTEGIKTQQRFTGQQQVNQRKESEAAVRFQNTSYKPQQYQTRIRE
jgi:hypothetical protein